MMQERPTVFVRISDGKNKIYNYRVKLWESGFVFNKRSHGKSYYEKEMTEASSEEWNVFCKESGLVCDIIPVEFTRSTDYRKTFFSSTDPTITAKYRCAYCGRKIIYKDVTVDHIFPINKLSYSERVRKQAAYFGITEANEEKNLCAACRTCNSRKGTKTGLWVIRGFLGKSNTLWNIRIAVRTALLIAFVFMAGYLFIQNTEILRHAHSNPFL